MDSRFEALPYEVQVHIIQSITGEGRLSALHSVCLVSKSLCEIATPELVKHFSFDGELQSRRSLQSATLLFIRNQGRSERVLSADLKNLERAPLNKDCVLARQTRDVAQRAYLETLLSVGFPQDQIDSCLRRLEYASAPDMAALLLAKMTRLEILELEMPHPSGAITELLAGARDYNKSLLGCLQQLTVYPSDPQEKAWLDVSNATFMQLKSLRNFTVRKMRPWQPPLEPFDEYSRHVEKLEMVCSKVTTQSPNQSSCLYKYFSRSIFHFTNLKILRLTADFGDWELDERFKNTPLVEHLQNSRHTLQALTVLIHSPESLQLCLGNLSGFKMLKAVVTNFLISARSQQEEDLHLNLAQRLPTSLEELLLINDPFTYFTNFSSICPPEPDSTLVQLLPWTIEDLSQLRLTSNYHLLGHAGMKAFYSGNILPKCLKAFSAGDERETPLSYEQIDHLNSLIGKV